MHKITPKVFILAETRVLPVQIENMLTEVAGKDWSWRTDAPSGAETIIEILGRLCYKSFGVGLNPNVEKTREGNQQYMENILTVKHGSVLEHASVTVGFINVSRVFTHEIVRHRAGTAFSQESLRFVRLDEIKYFLPETFNALIEDDELYDEVEELFVDGIRHSEQTYLKLVNAFERKGLLTNFSIKKMLTSALRRIAPIGLATNIGVTANHRAWRHIIEARTAISAEEELRWVIGMVARDFKKRYPNIYQDMEEVRLPREEDPLQLPIFKFQHSKV